MHIAWKRGVNLLCLGQLWARDLLKMTHLLFSNIRINYVLELNCVVSVCYGSNIQHMFVLHSCVRGKPEKYVVANICMYACKVEILCLWVVACMIEMFMC